GSRCRGALRDQKLLRTSELPPHPFLAVHVLAVQGAVHVRGSGDQVSEYPDKGQEEDEQEPEGLSPAAVVFATEVVDERPQDDEDPKEEQRGEDDGPEHAEQRIVIREHKGLLTMGLSPAQTLWTKTGPGITRTG